MLWKSRIINAHWGGAKAAQKEQRQQQRLLPGLDADKPNTYTTRATTTTRQRQGGV